ncbi:MAG: SurA N-terminal domain-containing protein [Desulfovibrionaceae bacterium]|nr:SurA N-terminal domain-containing protein [Desulfovibrionaceae bacterium]
MLDAIRSNAQSFWVKVAFGVIILVFVFWGVGSFTDTGFVNVLGTVNNEPITYQQFEEAYRQAEQSVTQNQRGTTLTAEQKTQLGRQVFQQLVSEAMISQEAKRIGLGVSPYELRMYVGSLQIFQNEKGQFDPEAYKNILQSRRQTPAAFEADLARRIIQDKMVNYVTAGSWSDSIEARNRFNFLRQRRVFEYVYIPADSEMTATSAPDDAAVAKYYEVHKTDYVIPQKVDVQYIVVDPLKVVSPDSITGEQARAYYDKNTSSFSEPESVEVSHILVPVEQNASEEVVKLAMDKALKIKQEIADGKPFAQAADEYNGPNAADKGGRVGWITPGVTVPEFEKAAFAAEPNVVSEPVRSQFGLHLILVTGRKDAQVKPFADVEGEIKSTLAALEGREGLADLLDNLTEDNILGKDLAEVASSRGLAARKSGLVSQQELQTLLGIKPEAAASIMGTAVNQPVDIPLEAGEAYVIVRVTGSAPSSFQPLEEVRDNVVAKIRTEEGMGKARGLLEAALKQAGESGLSAEWAARVKESAPVDRGSSIAPFMVQDELERAAFTAQPGSWLPAVYAVSTAEGQGVLICRVKQVMDPPDSEWQQFEGIMTGLTQRERQDGIMQAFMESLFKRSEVIVRNQDIIDRKNM